MSLLKRNDSHITFFKFSNVFLLLNVGSKVFILFELAKHQDHMVNLTTVILGTESLMLAIQLHCIHCSVRERLI
jgi:hypothetical protein